MTPEQLQAMNAEELIRNSLIAAVRLAITRHNIEFDEDTAQEEEVAEDAAGACFGEECCEDRAIPEVTELMRRLNPAHGVDSDASPAPDSLAHSSYLLAGALGYITPSAPAAPLTAEGAEAFDISSGFSATKGFQPAGCGNRSLYLADVYELMNAYAASETARADRAEQDAKTAHSLIESLREDLEQSRQFAADKGHEIVDLNNALAEARKAAEWVRCEDRLPEADTLVLIASNEGGVFTGKYRHFVGGRKFWLPTGNGTYAANWCVTHWRPLPEPPKSETPKETT